MHARVFFPIGVADTIAHTRFQYHVGVADNIAHTRCQYHVGVADTIAHTPKGVAGTIAHAQAQNHMFYSASVTDTPYPVPDVITAKSTIPVSLTTYPKTVPRMLLQYQAHITHGSTVPGIAYHVGCRSTGHGIPGSEEDKLTYGLHYVHHLCYVVVW
eukprot:3900315-Rhodomonas_salina.3